MRYPTPALWRVDVEAISVHDGDTLVHVIVDRGGIQETTERWDIRLKDVFAPELSQPGGRETRAFVEEWMTAHHDTSLWPFQLETFRTPRSDKDITTFGRYVGTIRAADGSELNAAVQEFVTTHGYPGGIGS